MSHSRFCSFGKLSPEDSMPLPCDCGESKRNLSARSPAQGTPEPPKVEEWGKIFSEEIRDSKDPVVRLADSIVYGCAIVTPRTDDNLGLFSDETYVKEVRSVIEKLRPYFPPASQTPTLEKVLDVVGGLIATYETGDHADNPCGNCVICTAEKILEELANPASTARTDGWVSVEESLPKADERVIVCTDKGDRWAARCKQFDNTSKYEKIFLPEGLHPVNAVITHWQPLPAAPGSVPPLCNDPDCGDCYDKREALEHAQKGVPQAEPPK